MDGATLLYRPLTLLSERDTTPIVIEGQKIERVDIPPIRAPPPVEPVITEPPKSPRDAVPKLDSPPREVLPTSPIAKIEASFSPPRVSEAPPAPPRAPEVSRVQEVSRDPEVPRSPTLLTPRGIPSHIFEPYPRESPKPIPLSAFRQPDSPIKAHNPLNQKDDQPTENYIPDWMLEADSRSEDEQSAIRSFYTTKLQSKKDSYPSLNIIVSVPGEKVSTLVHRNFVIDEYLKRNMSMKTNKFVLMGYFALLEIVAVKIFNITYAKGFCEMQLLMMEQYNALLIEMGDSFGGSFDDWPAFYRIIIFSLIYFVCFIVVSWILNKISPEHGQNIMRELAKAVSQGNTVSEGGSSLISKFVSMFNSDDGTLGKILGGLSGLMGGAAPTAAPAGTRNPVYNE